MKVLDGVTHVIYGVLGVSWQNYARYAILLLLSLRRIQHVHLNFWTGHFSNCFNFCQGEALFQTHENLEHLAMMERVLGPVPDHMLRRAEYVPVCGTFVILVRYIDGVKETCITKSTISLTTSIKLVGKGLSPFLKNIFVLSTVFSLVNFGGYILLSILTKHVKVLGSSYEDGSFPRHTVF